MAEVAGDLTSGKGPAGGGPGGRDPGGQVPGGRAPGGGLGGGLGGPVPAGHELATALKASRGALLMTGVFSLFINLLMLTSPLYMLQIYDRVLASRSEATLIVLTILAGGLLLVMGALDLIRSRVLVRIGARLDGQLSSRVFSAVFTQTLRGARGQRAQALRDLDSLRQFMTGPGPFAFFDAPWAPLYLLVIFLFHPLLGVIALIGGLVLFAMALVNELLTRRPLQLASGQAIAASGFAEATLRNAEVLEALGMMPAMRRRWAVQHDKGLNLQAIASDRGATLTTWSKATRIGLQVAMLCAGAYLAMQQIITPGVMIAASIVMGRALAPVEQAIGQWRHFVGARQAYRRLDELLKTVPAESERLSLPKPEGRISVEKLVALPPRLGSANGGTALPVLKGISFVLEPGDALGVIGPSASGKSTLARNLVGVWRPKSGAVRLDGAEVHSWNAEELGPHLGYLPQDVELFAGKISENIARFSAEATSEAVVAAARAAGVHEMILQLPEGYDSEIGDEGSVLSGGQRQRIGLARALYGEPALVVLDEPNANLDAAGDEALAKAILGLKARGATVVVMAHRPSAIAAVDKLLMLREGQILAFGPKEEVLAKVTKQAEPASKASAAGKVASLRSVRSESKESDGQ